MCFAVGSEKDLDICIIWGYRREGMLILFCSIRGETPSPQGRWEGYQAEVCLPMGWEQGNFRCPNLEQLSKVQFSCLCFSVSLTFLKYFWAGEADSFSYPRKVSVFLTSLTSKQGFAQVWHVLNFERGIHSGIVEKGGPIWKSHMKAESKLWPRDKILLWVLFLEIRSCFLVSWNSLGTGTNTQPSSLNPKISIWSHFSVSVWSHRVIDAFLNCSSVSKQRGCFFKSLSVKHKYKTD